MISDFISYIFVSLFKLIASLVSFLGINPVHLVAGIIGALVKTLVDRTRSKFEIASTMIVGGACASYLTPLVNGFVGIDIQQNNGLAFLIGMIGVYATQYAIKVSRGYSLSHRLPKIVEQWEPGETDDKGPSNSNQG